MDCRLIVTTDVHGSVSPYSYSDHQEINAGLAKLAGIIFDYKSDNSLLLDNGDILQGSPLLYHHYLFHKEKINPMAKVTNYLEYDYLNTGNHDFNFGDKAMMAFYRDAKAKWITGNILKDQTPINKPYIIHDFPNGVKIAIIGCVTHYIPNWEHPDNIVGYTFVNCLEFVKNTVELIKNNETVDHIICLYHGGVEKDVKTGVATEALTGENQGYEICRQIDELDVLITGHQHQSFVANINGTTITQCAQDGQEIVVIDIFKDKIEAKVIKAGPDIDDNVLTLIKDEEKSTQAWLDVPLGRLAHGDLLVNDMFEARLHKHPLVSFLNQVQKAETNVDISSIGLANHVVGFRNEISMRDIISSYVYPNTLVVVELSGKALKKALEKSAEYFAVKDSQIVVSESFKKPKPKHYNYDMFDGIDYTIKVSNPIGERIIDLTYQGQPIEDERLYQVAMNNYRAVGGGDFHMYKKARVIKDTQKHIVDSIADYIIERKIIEVDHQDNIKVII